MKQYQTDPFDQFLQTTLIGQNEKLRNFGPMYYLFARLVRIFEMQ